MASERLVKWMSEVEDTVSKDSHQGNDSSVGVRAPRVLLGCSGSVATIKVPLIASALQKCGVRVVVVPTAPALHFLLTAASQHESCNKASEPHAGLDKMTIQNQKLENNIEEQVAPSSQDMQCKNDSCSGSTEQCVMQSRDGKEFASLPETAASFESTSFSTRCYKCSQLFHSQKFISKIETPYISQSFSPKSTDDKTQRVDSSSESLSHISRNKALRTCGWCEAQQLHPELTLAGDEMEWGAWRGRGDPVLHIQLRRWADLMVIAPLSANTLAKLACGLCDNLLTCVARAWDLQKPLLFCPAMNTFMYDHPFTAQHVRKLKELGYTEVPAVSKRLMCGDVGGGAMAEVGDIVSAVHSALVSRGFDGL